MHNLRDFLIVFFGTILLVLLISGGIGALCWPYAINSWLIFLGKTPSVVWWQGALLGVVPGIGQASTPFAILTWILMLFLV